MYNYIQQQTPGKLTVPDRQNMMMPMQGCPGNGNYQPMLPGYPQNGMPSSPMMPMTPMMPTTPTMPGMPTSPMYPTTPMYPYQQQGPMGMQPVTGPDFGFEEGPPTLTDIGYTPAFLKTQIGRRVKIEFLIGTSMLVDREGTLMNVGINYVIIQESESDDLLLCDMYSIKFVKFFY